VFEGRAQEKTRALGAERRHDPTTRQVDPWLVRTTVIINHLYFYAVDADFGPFFLKFGIYFPYTSKL